jgi:hypothetical protein
MPANTPRLALPYPLGTDPVSDGDDAIKNLAQALDFGGVRVGSAMFPFAAAVNAVRKPTIQTQVYDAPTNASSLLTLTFPVAFTSQVFFFAATTMGGAQVNPVVGSSAITLTTVTIYVQGAPSTLVRGAYLVIGV